MFGSRGRDKAQLSDQALDLVFRDARSHNSWLPKPVSDDQLRALYDLARLGPTSANGNPARLLWVRSPEGKEKLAALVLGPNRRKVLQAPVTGIVGYDLEYWKRLDYLFAHNHQMLQERADRDPEWAREEAFRNSTLQGAYLIIAARALGLNAGPMSGFHKEEVDEAFFAGTTIKSNFLLSLGYGSTENLFPRLPRLKFEEANNFA